MASDCPQCAKASSSNKAPLERFFVKIHTRVMGSRVGTHTMEVTLRDQSSARFCLEYVGVVGQSDYSIGATGCRKVSDYPVATRNL
jgi:hypothetical protein